MATMVDFGRTREACCVPLLVHCLAQISALLVVIHSAGAHVSTELWACDEVVLMKVESGIT